jgi:hypothetical protein
MIHEALAYATTRADRHARAMGYVYESVALSARHRRCRESWEPHLARSRGFIRRCAAAAPDRGVAVVLGSGPLLDIPIDDLARDFSEVFLVDVAHPWSARRAARQHKNVRLVSCNLLGLDGVVACEGALPRPRCGAWRDHVPRPDFVVAASVLSQLPLKPLESWSRRLTIDAYERRDWSRDVVDGTLDDLRAGPGFAAVISETRRLLNDTDEFEPHGEDALFGVTLPPALERWQWVIAPYGEIERRRQTVLEISALTLPV